MGANAYCGVEGRGEGGLALLEEFPIQAKRRNVRCISRFD